LKRGLEEGIAHARGELTLRTVALPEPPPEITGKSLAALRTKAGMSQTVFARVLNVSPKTLQSWEQGVRRPADASRRLIQVFSEHPEVICKTAGLPFGSNK
jgi:putative transcriptional regulator